MKSPLAAVFAISATLGAPFGGRVIETRSPGSSEPHRNPYGKSSGGRPYPTVEYTRKKALKRAFKGIATPGILNSQFV